MNFFLCFCCLLHIHVRCARSFPNTLLAFRGCRRAGLQRREEVGGETRTSSSPYTRVGPLDPSDTAAGGAKGTRRPG